MAGGVHGKGMCMTEGHAWQGMWGIHDRGHAWQGGMQGRGHAWEERRPLERAIRILMKCIPVQ